MDAIIDYLFGEYIMINYTILAVLIMIAAMFHYDWRMRR